jgi:hypothetical protein
MTTNLPEILALYGNALAGVPVGPLSVAYVVDPTNGLDTNSGLSPEAALKTLAAAEDKCVANHHDVVLYIAASSDTAGTAYDLEATLTWDKNQTHLVGIGAPTMVGQRARIFLIAGNNDITPMIAWSASGCVVKNIYIFHGVADADSLIEFQLTGGRNYFENVHFAGNGHATQAVDGGAALAIGTSGSENTFVNCTVGVDTATQAAGCVALLFNGVGAARNIFKGCNFILQASAAGAAWIEMSAINSIDRYTIFDHCLFLNFGTTLTEGIVCPAGFDLANKRLVMFDCAQFGAPAWDASNRNVTVANMGTPTGVDASGTMLSLEG